MQLLKLNSIDDSRGSLISLEVYKNIPFEIKRVYYLFSLNSEPRGFHAHKQLKQFILCLSGSCTIKIDDGVTSHEYNLSSPNIGLFINSFEWREMYNFSKDCVILVLASDLYDENDYIRDYSEFLTLCKDKK